ncbi:MAG: fibronectin type III-like domain-contianing protein, partial [Bacteroidales bacterium]|nr:fibronectin type III-like domain-contianing protein [Bacteroidales bacterium]
GSLEKNPAQKFYAPCQPYDSPKRWQDFRYTFYQEGIFLGYRGVREFGAEPEYPFGYGLSYTSFEYSGLELATSADGVDVTFTVSNTGKCAGAEVVELYVSPLDSPVRRPERELKGFGKINLPKGGSSSVTIHLGKDAFSHYDVQSHGWTCAGGRYRILIGGSSEDIRLETTISR